MPKKSSLKPVESKPEEKDNVKETMPSPKRKKMGAEIEEIFAAKKRKKSEQETTGKTIKNKAANERRKERKKRRIEGSGSRERKVQNTPSRSRKKTNDGLTIYSEEELGFGKADAGGTRLCPFDCSCCF